MTQPEPTAPTRLSPANESVHGLGNRVVGVGTTPDANFGRFGQIFPFPGYTASDQCLREPTTSMIEADLGIPPYVTEEGEEGVGLSAGCTSSGLTPDHYTKVDQRRRARRRTCPCRRASALPRSWPRPSIPARRRLPAEIFDSADPSAAASASALLTLLTAGCAMNATHLDRATAMGEAGRAATAGTGKAMDALRSTNRDVLVDLVAMDPNCALPNPVVAAGRSDPAALICRAGTFQAGDFALRRWGARELRPSLTVIKALAAYLGAMDSVVARKPRDLGGELADAEAKLAGPAGDLTTIAGAAPPPPISADQRAAVQGTLALLSQIIDEASRVDNLRKMEIALDPAAFTNDLAALKRSNDGVVNRLGAQLQNQQTLFSLQLRQAREPNEKRVLAARSPDVIDARAAILNCAGPRGPCWGLSGLHASSTASSCWAEAS